MIELNKVYNEDCLNILGEIDNNSIDLVFTDPPYALGSELIIKENGKPDYKKAVDFMSKWEMPTGEFWEKYFNEVFRVLKYGGYCLMFGIDRQNFLFKYYASLSKLKERQSLYWYFISSFPKAMDLSKQIDKYYGEVGSYNLNENDFVPSIKNRIVEKISSKKALKNRSTPNPYIYNGSNQLAKKYNGYKYSVAPLKQTCETIMVFQKPYKTGSCLHDVLEMENGDNEITCGALNIDGERVPTSEKWVRQNYEGTHTPTSWAMNNEYYKESHPNGRFPPQTFIDDDASERLDNQGQTSKGYGVATNGYKNGGGSLFNVGGFNANRYDMGGGGSSKILHKCSYEEDDYDFFIYSPKISSSERNFGCDNLNDKVVGHGNLHNSEGMQRFKTIAKNNHPTVKPLKLLRHILNLFKTPDKKICLDTFAGSGSTLVACKELGFDFIGVEIKEEYCIISNARLKNKNIEEDLFKVAVL